MATTMEKMRHQNINVTPADVGRIMDAEDFGKYALYSLIACFVWFGLALINGGQPLSWPLTGLFLSGLVWWYFSYVLGRLIMKYSDTQGFDQRIRVPD